MYSLKQLGKGQKINLKNKTYIPDSFNLKRNIYQINKTFLHHLQSHTAEQEYPE